MKVTINNKTIEADTQEVIALLKELVNTEKLLKYGEILVQFSDMGATVIVPENGITKALFEIKDEYSDNSSYEKMKTLASVCNIVACYTEWDNTKHSKYRMRCGVVANDDESIKKIEDIIGEDNYNKLQERGYDVIED